MNAISACDSLPRYRLTGIIRAIRANPIAVLFDPISFCGPSSAIWAREEIPRSVEKL
jgi:hypothetical protein